MQILSYTALRSNLASTMAKVCHDHSPITVTRANAEPVVMVSLEDYEAMIETAYLMQSPNNANRLNAAIDEIEQLIATCK